MERKNEIQELTEDMEYGLTGLLVPDYYFEHKSRGSHSLPFLLHLHALLPPPVLRLLWLKVRELNPLHRHTKASMFYHATRWGSEMTWGKWQEQARAAHLASPLISTLIHLFQGRHPNTSFSCSAQPFLWPTVHWSASLLIDITVQRNTASN